jgi:hypothetical protein
MELYATSPPEGQVDADSKLRKFRSGYSGAGELESLSSEPSEQPGAWVKCQIVNDKSSAAGRWGRLP